MLLPSAPVTSLRARTGLLLMTIAAVAACGTGTSPEAQPSASSSTTAAETTAAATTEPEPTPSGPVTDSWATEEDAIASLAEFVAEVEQTDRFRFARQDTLGYGPDYINMLIEYVVDLGERRLGAVQTFEASSDEIAAEMLGEAGAHLADLESHSVIDYSGGSMRALLTYPSKWDGRWLEITAEAAAAEDPTLGEMYAQSDPTALTVPFVEVAALRSVAFAPSDDTLTFNVPADVALGWVSTRTALAFEERGIDVLAASPANALAYATPVAGGIEIILDLTPLFGSVPAITELMGGAHTLVTMRVTDLNTTDEIVIPAEGSISTEPWE
jgi:hypothetical protein